MSVIPLQRDVEYPDSDGQPMAESDLHREEMLNLIKALQRRYRATQDVYVAGNLFIYYRKDDARAAVAPDVFLVRGVPKKKRRIYKLWEEGHAPSLVIEVTSDSTSGEDLTRKKALYEKLGIEEYFLHDPLGDYLKPRLQGHRLVDGRYQAIRPNPEGSLNSRSTGLTLKVEGENLRLTDTATGEPLLWIDEIETARQAAEEARQAAEHALQAVEEELARLRQALNPSEPPR